MVPTHRHSTLILSRDARLRCAPPYSQASWPHSMSHHRILRYLVLLCCWVHGLSIQGAEVALVKGRPSIVMQNPTAEVVLDLNGGAIGDFHLKGSDINPLHWATPEAGDTSMRGFGHFLCLDRWGPPSDAEGAKGMPYHGEATHVVWNETNSQQSSPNYTETRLHAKLPMAGLAVNRRVRLSSTQAYFVVREEVTNENPLGRLYNMVQHPTIGPPFLDELTVVDCNGRRGFAQGNPLPHPEEPSSYWPVALNADGTSINIRKLTNDPNPNVVSYHIEMLHGWVTAASPTHGLLIGYIWRTSEYPWVSLWRDVRDGKPAARGLEFGSTGLHQPFPILTQVRSIWNQPVFEYLDTGEKRAKSYAAFLVKIPGDFQGVSEIAFNASKLIIHERSSQNPRKFSITLSEDLMP